MIPSSNITAVTPKELEQCLILTRSAVGAIPDNLTECEFHDRLVSNIVELGLEPWEVASRLASAMILIKREFAKTSTINSAN